jgi:hypothetical protein
MLRLLRRFQPPTVPLALLYWAAIVLATGMALLVLFTMADRLLPGAGQL